MEPNQNNQLNSKPTNQPVDQGYYTSKKRKFTDFLVRGFKWLLILTGLFLLFSFYSHIFGFQFSLLTLIFAFSIMLLFQNKIIFWVIIALPFLLGGWCFFGYQ